MSQNDALRAFLVRALDWQETHVNFETAVQDVPPEQRGIQPAGLPYSLWQLLEHMRLTQLDILEFCRNPSYKEPKGLEEYWPPTAAPPTLQDWDESIRRFRRDREALKQLALDSKIDLFARIPHGTGQTYLRELLLVVDHNAYHIGQVVVIRRLLGIRTSPWTG